MLGFTAQEIEHFFTHSIKEVLKKRNFLDPQDVMKELNRYYNGYLQSPFAETPIFNPTSIQHYFANDGNLQDYFAWTGGTEILFKLLKNQSITMLSNFLKGVLVDDKGIEIEKTSMITPQNWLNVKNDFYQIAFDAGYLTYSFAKEKCFLKIPNQEIRNDFSKMIKTHMFSDCCSYTSLLQLFIAENFGEFFKNLELFVFQKNSILNLKDRAKESLVDRINYEVFLQQACSIAFKEMLIDNKSNRKIDDFRFENEFQVLKSTELYVIKTKSPNCIKFEVFSCFFLGKD